MCIFVCMSNGLIRGYIAGIYFWLLATEALCHVSHEICDNPSEFYVYYLVYYALIILFHICIYIKNFVWEDQRQRRCYIIHIAPKSVNSAVLLFFNPPIHHSKPNQRSMQQHTYRWLITNYKNNKSIQSRKKSVQSLNNKLKRSAIIKSKATPPLDPRSIQTHASRTHWSKLQSGMDKS